MTEREQKTLTLARQMLSAVHSEAWRDTILPFIQNERDCQIDLLNTVTDVVQLARYGGAVQALTSLIRVEERARAVLQASQNKPIDNPASLR